MKTRALAMLVLAGLAAAAEPTVWVRSPATGFCWVRGASTTTPIRLTVAGNCGLFTGSLIVVVDVRGNLAANIHVENPGDTANFARKVANLSGDSFDLLDLNGRPVASSGAYTGGGRVGLAEPRAMRPLPVLYFDGPAGPRTAAMSDPGNKANKANPGFAVMLANAASYAAQYGRRWGYEWNSQYRGAPTLEAALSWRLDGNAATRDAALFGLRNPDQIIGSTACDEKDKDCRLPLNSLAAYPLGGSLTYMQAYTLMRDQLTPAERTRFLNFFLSDLPWTEAGINYSGTALVKPKHRATTGTVTVAPGGTRVIGDGTHFRTQTAVGDFIIVPTDSYGRPYLVESIASDTELTTAAPVNSPTGAGSLKNSTWLSGPRWDPSMYGFLWNQKHFIFTPLNGGGEPPPGSPYAVSSPYLGELSGFYQIGDHNHSIDRGTAMYAIGLATCHDDPRGCLLATMAYEWLYDRALPPALSLWTGFSQANPIYHQGATVGRLLQWALWTINSLVDGPDPFEGTNVREQIAWWLPFATIPQGAYMPNAEQALIAPSTDRMLGSLLAMAAAPDTIAVRGMQWWLRNVNWYQPSPGSRFPYGPNAMGYASGGWAWEHYLLYEPTTAALPIEATTHHFTESNAALCEAIFGANCVAAPDVRRVSISRSDWTDSATFVAVNATGYGCRDHCSDDLGGYFYIFKEGQPLVAADRDNLMGERKHRGYVEVGSEANYQIGDDRIGTPTVWTAGDNDFMFARVDLTAAYKPAARVRSLERQIFHLKQGSADFVVDHVKGTLDLAQSVHGYQHYNLNGCGTPAATGCASINRPSLTGAHAQRNARVNSKVFAVAGSSPVTIATATGSENDGSYPGGNGQSFRWHVCPATAGPEGECTAASAFEWIVVHQPSADPGAGMPELAHRTVGPFRIIEIAEPGAPKVLAFTATGQIASSLALTTSHDGEAQYLVTGLEAGLYQMKRNGVLIGEEPRRVESGSHSLSFRSAAGELLIEPAPDALAMSPAPLPAAVAGQPYRALVALKTVTGQEPYRWQLAGGSLCAGLSLGQSETAPAAAIINGTVRRAAVCSFRLQVQDASGRKSDRRKFTIKVAAFASPAPPPRAIKPPPAQAVPTKPRRLASTLR